MNFEKINIPQEQEKPDEKTKLENIYHFSEERDKPWTFEELNVEDEDGYKKGGDATVVEHIIIRNIPAETEALLAYYQANDIPVSKEMLDQVRPFEQQRLMTHEQMAEENGSKYYNNNPEKPEMTELEKKLGLYIDTIEPQVRQAVIDINAKGYQTYYSGFEFGGEQVIWCKEDYFENYQPSEELISKLNEQGIDLEVKANKLEFQPRQLLELNELAKAWHDIISDLPDLNKKENKF